MDLIDIMDIHDEIVVLNSMFEEGIFKCQKCGEKLKKKEINCEKEAENMLFWGVCHCDICDEDSIFLLKSSFGRTTHIHILDMDIVKFTSLFSYLIISLMNKK